MTSVSKDLIQKISDIRDSNVICYIAGERQNISTRIAPDIIPVFYEHLERLDKNKKIDLVLFTKGGDVLTALRLVQLIYEYTDNFSVLVPYKAYSAGTLICLGASEIGMTKIAELGPVDPNVTSKYNPSDENNPTAKMPINVEDVYSFIDMAKDIIGIKSEPSLESILSHLVDNIHPLAIGSIYRTYSLIRKVATKLLLLHMPEEKKDEISNIVDYLTEKFFSHSYMISRKEAKNSIQLPVTYCDGDLEEYMWELYKAYEDDLMLKHPFIPERSADANGRFKVYCGVIESMNRADGYMFEGIVQRPNGQDEHSAGSVNILSQGWKEI